ncbi:MAG TPA: aminoglycoside phosphotransferase family protein [Aggregatilinea sp.]|uniref:phosphotransferase family protein n=1 Tax=Aggregatilinea sp. TaxID=2806333 RepID=UPI002D167873|nr:aminoglycoside phosphotransferase family protein [Aggregatilinea sp.]HML20331.1 aminoglycoside phosphotransferase family protein [Aggregatilinea sp.]
MESKTKNRKTREQVAGMVEKAFGGVSLAAGEDVVTELKEGWFNAAYNVRLSDSREVILKIAPPVSAEVMTYEKNIMTTEVASMHLVAQNPAIPVPEIYCFDTDRDLCDSDYFFMEKLAGDNLEHVKASLPPELQAQIDQSIGAIIREINGFTGTYFGYDGNDSLRSKTWRDAFIKIADSVLDDGLRKDAEYGFSVDDIRDAILKHASALEEVTTPQLVHWDAWDLNFFVKEGRITGILDFERALWADPLMEAQFRAVTFGDISESLKGYGKTSFTHAEEARCCLYTLHLGLVMKTECYYRNYDTDFVSNLAMQMIVPTMKWLQEN